jgi:hypothetical protein
MGEVNAVPVPVPVPRHMAGLPVDHAGRPVPWFVARFDGVPDPRVGDGEKWIDAVKFRRCWVCGGTLGRWVAFVLGPMCAVSKVTAEPGCHLECAVYSARACPFLARPEMRRRERGITPGENGFAVPAGQMIRRNPGVTAVWVTQRFHPTQTPTGPLICLGPAQRVLWFCRGQPATAAQARAALESGIPLLRAACDSDDDPADSRAALEKEIAAARKLLPR